MKSEKRDTLPRDTLTLEVGNVVRTKKIEVAYDGEGGLLTANFSAGRGKRFIIAVLGTTDEGGEINVDQLLRDLGWEKAQNK